MTCQTFDQVWNELLDAETAGARERPTTLLREARPRIVSRPPASTRRAVPPVCSARPGMSFCARPCAPGVSRLVRPRRLRQTWSSGFSRRFQPRFGSSTLPIGQPKPATRHWRIGLPLGAAIAAVAAVLILFVVPITWDRKRLDVGHAPRGAMNQPSGVSGPSAASQGTSAAVLTSRRRWRARPRRPGTWRSPRRSPPPGWAVACLGPRPRRARSEPFAADSPPTGTAGRRAAFHPLALSRPA